MCRVVLLALVALATPANAQCMLCAKAAPTAQRAPDRPLTIDIETSLDFSRAAQTTRGGGSIAVDERSGARSVVGLVDLGGIAVKGTVRVTGEPGRHVRVGLPSTVRLSASDGGSADIIDLRDDLPPDPVINGSGVLNFSFGGRLRLSAEAAGDFHGRVPISVDYQ